MHIFALEKYPSSQRGGQELSLFDMCQGLTQARHEVSLLHENIGNLLDRYQHFCQQITHVASFSGQRYTLTNLSFFRALLQVSRQINQAAAPLLYCNQIDDIPFPTIVSRLTRTPLVCHLRLAPPPNFERLRYKIAIRCIDRFFTVSEHTRQQWIEFGIPAEKIVAIHNGTNPQKFAPRDRDTTWLQQQGIPADAKILAYSGRIDYSKGIETLLFALAQLKQQFPNIHLLLAGKPVIADINYQTKLEQIATEREIRDRTHFLGHLEDTSQLYTSSDLTIVPSIWPEPFGKVIIESMACGTPVVASRTGGIPEILTNEFAAGLCEPKNHQDFAAKIAELIQWPVANPELGQRSRNHVLSNFTLTTVVDRLEQEMLQVRSAKGFVASGEYLINKA